MGFAFSSARNGFFMGIAKKQQAETPERVKSLVQVPLMVHHFGALCRLGPCSIFCFDETRRLSVKVTRDRCTSTANDCGQLVSPPGELVTTATLQQHLPANARCPGG